MDTLYVWTVYVGGNPVFHCHNENNAIDHACMLKRKHTNYTVNPVDGTLETLTPQINVRIDKKERDDLLKYSMTEAYKFYRPVGDNKILISRDSQSNMICYNKEFKTFYVPSNEDELITKLKLFPNPTKIEKYLTGEYNS